MEKKDVTSNFEDHNGSMMSVSNSNGHNRACEIDITAPATPLAKTWDGYGTALKPAWEPVIVARKPLDGTVADNCVEYGAGALWIDGARVQGELQNGRRRHGGGIPGNGSSYELPDSKGEMPAGRWPANLIHDGSEEVVERFPETKSGLITVRRSSYSGDDGNKFMSKPDSYQMTCNHGGDSGSAARFFYCAKASKAERDAGCEGLEEIEATDMTGRQPDSAGLLRVREDGSIGENPYAGKSGQSRNHHPTVKPIALTKYLARLILPPKEYAPRRILVPFSGSGSEIIGALRAGWEEITGIEMLDEYIEIAEARLKYWESQPIQESLFRD